MYKKDAIEHYGGLNHGGQARLAEVLDITPGSVSQWGDLVPEKQALKLEKLTKGKLKYDPALYTKVA